MNKIRSIISFISTIVKRRTFLAYGLQRQNPPFNEIHRKFKVSSVRSYIGSHLNRTVNYKRGFWAFEFHTGRDTEGMHRGVATRPTFNGTALDCER